MRLKTFVVGMCVGVLVGACAKSPEELSKAVGPEGGTVGVEGLVSLEIPPGALEEETEIGVAKLSAAEASAQLEELDAKSPVFAFTPHGLTFAKPVQVELAFAEGGEVEVLRKATPEAAEWTAVAAETAGGKARFEIFSFSLYVVVQKRSSGCGLDAAFDFSADPTDNSLGWAVSANLGADLAGSWNDGTDGSRFTDGHFRLATAGASQLGNIAHVVSPVFQRGACSTVRVSFNHEIVTNAQALGTAVMSAELAVVENGQEYGHTTGTVIKEHAPATDLGEVPTLSYDITHAIPESGSFRLVWRSKIKAAGEAARWVFDDVHVQGEGEVAATADAGVSTGSTDGGTDITCDAPVSAETGTATLSGVTALPSPVDAFAVRRLTQTSGEGGTRYTSQLRIRLSGYAQACGHELAGNLPGKGTWYDVVLTESSDTAFPAAPSAGTYSFTATPQLGTPHFSAGFGSDCSGACGFCGSLISDEAVGSLTLSAIDTSSVSGTFTLEPFGPGNGTESGTFNAPFCDSTVPEGQRCCADVSL